MKLYAYEKEKDDFPLHLHRPLTHACTHTKTHTDSEIHRVIHCLEAQN
jgi:hypothetical protein